MSKPIVEQTKKHLADPNGQIVLDDLLIEQMKKVLPALTSEFETSGSFTPDEFKHRLDRYQELLVDLIPMTALISRWGREDSPAIVAKVLSRLAQTTDTGGGLVAWIELRWHPVCLLMYAAGVSAVIGQKFDNLAAALLSPIPMRNQSTKRSPLVVQALGATADIEDLFKKLPGLENKRRPRNEYYFELLRPIFEELFFLGADYEAAFDYFEIMSSLTYADLTFEERGHIWAPPGRFIYSQRGYNLASFGAEVSALAKDWPGHKAGFFKHPKRPVSEVLTGYEAFLSQIRWR